jgi:hypothetical protein
MSSVQVRFHALGANDRANSAPHFMGREWIDQLNSGASFDNVQLTGCLADEHESLANIDRIINLGGTIGHSRGLTLSELTFWPVHNDGFVGAGRIRE